MNRLIALAAIVGIRILGLAAPDGPYTLIKEIRVGGEGGWDYLTADPPNKRLYVSHGNKAVVIDLSKDAVIGEIADTPGIHGAVAATPGRGFTSNGRGNNASIVDAKTLQTISRTETEGNPDYIMFEPQRKEVYTFNGRGRSATVIGADSGQVVATIPLGGKPEAAVTDATAERVYVNIEDKNTVAVIDIPTHKVVANWPIAPGEEAAGLAIDPKNHRLFIGASNKLMLMMDSTTGTIVGKVAVGPGVDATVFDPATGYAFSSSGDGTTTIAHEDSPARLSVVQVLKTAPGARTMALDPTTHRIYLPTANVLTLPPETPGGLGRITIEPNSMKILVYGLNGK